MYDEWESIDSESLNQMVLFRATISEGGGGVSESMDGWGCAILALEVIPKNLIFT